LSVRGRPSDDGSGGRLLLDLKARCLPEADGFTHELADLLVNDMKEARA
jgi:hypothetical protein